MAVKKSSKRQKFVYKPRSREDIKKRQHQSSSSFDSVLRDGIQTFTPKEGDYQVRFMPPTWENANHYGVDTFIHYGVGPDNQQYLCRREMGKGECPICDERHAAQKRGDEDEAKKLKPSKRISAFVIDRDAEDEGPRVWMMPMTIDVEVANRTEDKASKELLKVDHPEEGYDVSFTREGSGLNTRYVAVDIARRETPLHRDPEVAEDWLNYCMNNPLIDLFVDYDEEYLQKVFEGKAIVKDDDDDDEEEDEVDEHEDEEEAELEDEDDDDEDEDDDDEDDDDDDEEEVERPKRQRASANERLAAQRKRRGTA